MTDNPTTEQEITPEQAEMIQNIERLGALLTGRPRPSATPTPRDVLCETDAFISTILDPQLGWLDEHSIVFVPDDSGDGSDLDQVVTYEGNMAMGGDELSLASMFRIQFQEYSISPYVPVVGATLVRIASEEDREAFFEDADIAMRTGDFSAVVTNPLVELADQCALGGNLGCTGLSSLYVSADGQVSTAVGGVSLGYVSEGFDAIERRFAESHGSCTTHHLGAVVNDEQMQMEIDQRPWIAGYLRALTHLKMLQAQGKSQLRVSGFGERLAPGMGDRPYVDGEHILIYDRERAYVYGQDGKQFGLGMEAAVCFEALHLTGERRAAIEAVATYASTSAEAIEPMLEPVLDTLLESGLVAASAN